MPVRKQLPSRALIPALAVLLCALLTGCATTHLTVAPLPETQPFAKEINAFTAADATNPPPRSAILFVGSSSIRLWKTLTQDFPDLRVVNRGFGGSQIIDSVNYADRVNLLPVGIFGVAIGVALLPLLARQIQAGNEAAALANQNRAIERYSCGAF